MKSFDTDIKKYADRTRLKASERAELRERVVAYMEYHPLPHAKREHSIAGQAGLDFGSAKEKLAALVSRFQFHTLQTRVLGGVFAVLLMVTVPFAAEQAAPGDVLYLVKTKVNEPVLAQFNNSPYEKVAFETTLMERRIAEARLLAKEGKLSEETEAALALSIQGHANAAQEGIDTLKANDAETGAIAEITFGSVLDVQTAVLDSTAGLAMNDSIAGAVREAKFAVDAKRSTSTPSYDRLMAYVEQETTRAHELFDAIEESATPEEKANIERRLADLERKIASAQQIHATGAASPDDALDSAADSAALMTISLKAGAPSDTDALSLALGDLKKIIVFMTDIDVRHTVKLETLVPVTPTHEEEVLTQLEDLESRREGIETEAEELEDAELKSEAELQLGELDALFETAATLRRDGNIADVENLLPDITAKVSAIEILVSGSTTIEAVVPVEPVDTDLSI